MSFSHLGLSDKVLAAVAATGYTTPTPIQEQAIPHVLARRDVLGIAQTGTGKTAAFVLPMLTMLEKGRARARMPRTLILEPTRELAAQVKEKFDKYGAGQKLNVALLIGGVSFGDQDTKLTRGVDVLIATPGRLLDHTERGGLLLTGVELLVIDEADRMLDMGFIPDIERICKLIPFTRQTLFFTATMPPEIRRITETFLHNPVKIEVSRPATDRRRRVTQFQVAGRPRAAREARGAAPPAARRQGSARTRSSSATASAKSRCCTNRCRSTASASAPCMATWISRRARRRSINSARAKFRCWSPPTSPPAASTFPTVSHVFNFDVPHHADDYVHRIGRTGRAGRAGTAISIVTPLDQKSIAAIEKLIGQTIPRVEGTPSLRRRDGAGGVAGGEANGRGIARTRSARTRRRKDHAKSRGGRKPRREREPRRPGGGRHRARSRTAPAAAFAPPAAPAPSRTPSIGRAEAPRPPRDAASEPADHSHLPAFLLRPVRARGLNPR